MKAQELRIGNFVWNPVQEIAVRVDLRLLPDILMRQKAKIDIGWEPIPLAEQWLIDFGFSPSYFESGELAFWRIDGRDFLNKNMEIRWFNTKIEYVHQLQNLYFSLTGQELQL